MTQARNVLRLGIFFCGKDAISLYFSGIHLTRGAMAFSLSYSRAPTEAPLLAIISPITGGISFSDDRVDFSNTQSNAVDPTEGIRTATPPLKHNVHVYGGTFVYRRYPVTRRHRYYHPDKWPTPHWQRLSAARCQNKKPSR